MKLVLIHGRSQQGKDPVKLKNDWLKALKEGLKKQGLTLPVDTEVEFPFYGDRLDELTNRSEVPLSEDIVTRGGDADSDYMEFRAEMLDAFRLRAGITDDQVNSEYGDNPMPKGPQNWEWVIAMTKILNRIPGMANELLEKLTKDVFLYVKRAGVRAEIDEIIAGALSTEPTVVVSHSLGTVVSYSVLRNDPRALRVPLYMTLGSPLGIGLIRNEFKPLKFPRPTSAWYNAFDKRDIVALYPLNNEYFPVKPPIENKTVINDAENRHEISGYLKDAAVAGRIYGALIQK